MTLRLVSNISLEIKAKMMRTRDVSLDLRWLVESTHTAVAVGVAFVHFSYVVVTTTLA